MSKTSIEWTEQTWNPIVGCSIVSPGCTNCYAMKMASRIEAMGNQLRYAGTTKKVKGNAVWTGKLAQAPESVLLAPLRRKKPTTYFVNSMGDLFHEDCPDEWIDRVFAVMALCPQHTFQVLTKRAARMREYFAKSVKRGGMIDCSRADRIGDVMLIHHQIDSGFKCVSWPLPNVWLGVSTERQQEADERIPLLLQTPAAVRFISAEPLLGPLRLDMIAAPKLAPDDESEGWKFNCLDTGDHYWLMGDDPLGPGERCIDSGDGPYREHAIDWVIVGGESGPGARPMHPDWARSLRDQCAAAGVAYFFKQWGEFLPVGQHLPGHGKIHGATSVKPGRMKLHYGGTPERAPDHAFSERGVDFASTVDGRLTFRVGKKSAGRLLDGITHDAMPQVHR